MHIVRHYTSSRDPGTSNIARFEKIIGNYSTAAEAREQAEACAKMYSRSGYNGERDYFWGWNEGVGAVNYFAVIPDPVDDIVKNSFVV